MSETIELRGIARMVSKRNISKHKWVWVSRWNFRCEKCGAWGDFDDGDVSEEVIK